MRRVFALLLSVLMVMSLLVVAGAEGTDVTLSIEPRTVAQGATTVLFDIYLTPNGTKKIGAFQFSVSGEGCTITRVADINRTLKYSEDKGAFAYFGGDFTGNVYTFVAAGTVQKEYTDDQGHTYPAHIWNAAGKTKIVTLEATINPGASSCQLNVDVDKNSDKRFSVGYDDGTGKGVRPCYTVAVDSTPANLSGSGALPGDVTVIPQCDALKKSYTVNSQEVTVTYGTPCRVGYLEGGKYVAVTPTQSGASYVFTIPSDVHEVILVAKGDVNSDGKANGKDWNRLQKHLNETEPFEDAAVLFAADVNGDGKVNGKDWNRLQKHLNETEKFAW